MWISRQLSCKYVDQQIAVRCLRRAFTAACSSASAATMKRAYAHGLAVELKAEGNNHGDMSSSKGAASHQHRQWQRQQRKRRRQGSGSRPDFLDCSIKPAGSLSLLSAASLLLRPDSSL